LIRTFFDSREKNFLKAASEIEISTRRDTRSP
jgi:hypothetical protein